MGERGRRPAHGERWAVNCSTGAGGSRWSRRGRRRAWLAVAPPAVREALLAGFAGRRGDWPRIALEIEQAIGQVERLGWCAASWQPEIVALAMPLALRGDREHVLNISVSSSLAVEVVAGRLAPALLALGGSIEGALLDSRRC